MKPSVFKVAAITIGAILAFAGASCGEDDSQMTTEQKKGTLVFTANGEDFARNGFVSEDGYSITFEHVYVVIYGPTAYQVPEAETHFTPMHAGHPHADIPEGSAHVALTGYYVVDLAQGDAPLELGSTEAPIGNYNRVNFELKRYSTNADSEVHFIETNSDDLAEFEGYSLILVGTAEKDGNQIRFTIKFSSQFGFKNCGPNGTAGVVQENGTGTAEITFHLDHIFGDAEAGPADTDDPESVNYGAVGFGLFAQFAANGELDISESELGENLNGTEFNKLMNAIYTIGHSGEAHCDYYQIP